MKETRRIIYSIVTLGAVLCIFAFFYIKKEQTHYAKINDRIIAVEYAIDDHEQSVGLGDREGLCEHCGMLFIFPDDSTRVFWMKNMQFDLDVLWIRDDRIIGIQENISHERQEKEIFSSPGPVDAVLELSAGFIAQNDLAIGQPVEFFDK